MYTMLRRFLFLCVVCLYTNILTAQEVGIFASPSGKGNKGTLQEPCSLETARNKVRQLNKNMKSNIVACNPVVVGGFFFICLLQYRI
jgi:hypothetical protein